MELQRNWKRPQKIEAESIVFKYYEKYAPYPTEYQGNVHVHCKCIYACSEVVRFKKKNGEDGECERLSLAFLHEDGKHFFDTQIWGARKRSDGTWGDNPEELQDFLYLCETQCPHSTEQSITRNSDYGDQTFYPLIAGQIFSLVIAKTGERMYKGSTYDQNKCNIFMDNGFSALELQDGVKIPVAWKTSVNYLHKKYCEFKGIAYTPKYNLNKGNAAPVVNTSAPAPTPTPTQTVNSAENTAAAAPVDSFADVDIPF